MPPSEATRPIPADAMALRLIDCSLATPEENLALDEALLLDLDARCARAGDDEREAAEPGWLRFWESDRYFVVLGVSGRMADDVHVERCRADGVPILRRASGGGTALQGPGCINFTLALPLASDPALTDIRRSYTAVVERTGDGLAIDGVAMRRSCDLALADVKFSGNAQKRKRHTLLHQGSILYDFDLARIPRYLAEPPKQPEYRRRRRHDEFVRNLPLDAASVRERIRRTWGAEPVAESSEWPIVAELVASKYGRAEWTERF